MQCGLEDPSNKSQDFTLFLDESHNFAEERDYNDNDALITDNFGSHTAHSHPSQPLHTSTSSSLTPFKSFDPLTMLWIAAKYRKFTMKCMNTFVKNGWIVCFASGKYFDATSPDFLFNWVIYSVYCCHSNMCLFKWSLHNAVFFSLGWEKCVLQFALLLNF